MEGNIKRAPDEKSVRMVQKIQALSWNLVWSWRHFRESMEHAKKNLKPRLTGDYAPKNFVRAEFYDYAKDN